MYSWSLSAVSEQDGRVFDLAYHLASKSLNFCLSFLVVFSFFRCFRKIMAVYVTREESSPNIDWCT